MRPIWGGKNAIESQVGQESSSGNIHVLFDKKHMEEVTPGLG